MLFLSFPPHPLCVRACVCAVGQQTREKKGKKRKWDFRKTEENFLPRAPQFPRPPPSCYDSVRAGLRDEGGGRKEKEKKKGTRRTRRFPLMKLPFSGSLSPKRLKEETKKLSFSLRGSS